MKVFTIKDVVKNNVDGYRFSGCCPVEMDLLYFKVDAQNKDVDVDIIINGASITYNEGIKADTVLLPENRFPLQRLNAGDRIEIVVQNGSVLNTNQLVSITFFGE